MSDIAIKLDGVWKIFGERAQDAMAAVVKEGLSKREVLARFDAVVGIADVSFNVRRGRNLLHYGAFGQRQIHAHPPHQPID